MQYIYIYIYIYIWRTADSLFRSPGRQTSMHWYYIFTWKMVLKRLFNCDTGEESTLYIHYLGFSGDRAHWVHMIVLLWGWSWRGLLLVTQGLIFEYFHFWKGMVVQKGLVFDNFHFGKKWWSWKHWFWDSSLWKGVMDLKGLILDKLHYGRLFWLVRLISVSFHFRGVLLTWNFDLH